VPVVVLLGVEGRAAQQALLALEDLERALVVRGEHGELRGQLTA
jgi:hypothetical protein